MNPTTRSCWCVVRRSRRNNPRGKEYLPIERSARRADPQQIDTQKFSLRRGFMGPRKKSMPVIGGTSEVLVREEELGQGQGEYVRLAGDMIGARPEFRSPAIH
jgi:hypothetical protein